MAGAGYKLFNTGDVLTAAQVNTYLMEQSVMVFADAAARTTALSGVVAEGMLSYLKDTNAVEVYNGSAWVASDDPNAIQNTIVDAKGDLIAASANDTPARLAVGTNDYFLQAASGETTGLKWGGTFSTYTPVLYQNGNVATSTAIGRFIKIGKFIHGVVLCVASANGSANQKVYVTIPATAQRADVFLGAGVGTFYDSSSTNIYPMQAVVEDGQYFSFPVTNAVYVNGQQYLGINQFTAAIASGDQIGFRFSYEVA